VSSAIAGSPPKPRDPYLANSLDRAGYGLTFANFANGYQIQGRRSPEIALMWFSRSRCSISKESSVAWDINSRIGFHPLRRGDRRDAPRSLLQVVKCLRIRLAVSLAPQRQPHGMSRPAGRPRLAVEDRAAISEMAGRFGQTVKWARISCSLSLAPQRQSHAMRGPRGRTMRLNVGSRCQFLTRTRGTHRPQTGKAGRSVLFGMNVRTTTQAKLRGCFATKRRRCS
jgi:hypothetical protein